MWVFHLSYPLFAHLFTEQNSSILPMNNSPLSPLSPASFSFSTSPSKSLRTPATENPWTSTRIHKRNAGSLLSLSAQPSSPTFSSAVTPLIVPTTHGPCPAECWSRNWISECVLESDLWWSQFLYPTSRRPRSTPLSYPEVLCDFGLAPPPPSPPLPIHTSRRPLPRRHNWSPRAKWHSALTDIRAANIFSYFTATVAASRSSTQSSSRWNNQDPSPRVVTQALSKERGEKDDLGRGDVMSGSFEHAHRGVSLHVLNREKSRWFSDASSCKVENHITLLKIQWTKNLREQLLEGDWDIQISMNE